MPLSGKYQVNSSGVPQGSVVGPILFLIYINYVASALNSQYAFFADDFKLFLSLPQQKSSDNAEINMLQADINLVYETSNSWGLDFFLHKCCAMHFVRGRSDFPVPSYTINSIPLNVVTCQRDLGVLVHSSLKFHSHVREITNKANGIAGNILRCTVCRSPAFMRKVFISHIRPILDFSSVLWNTGYMCDDKLIESVLRRWTRQIAGFEDMSYPDRLKQLNLFSMKGRLMRADLIQIWKILHGHSPKLDHLLVRNNIVPTRGHPMKLFIPRSNTDIHLRSFPIRCLNLWNGLPADVVLSPSLSVFKKNIARNLAVQLYTPAY